MNQKNLYNPTKGKEGKQTQESMDADSQSDVPLSGRFEFREIRAGEAQQAAEMEKICFPPNEACNEAMMRERVAEVPEMFLVAADRETGRLAGLINGIVTDEYSLRDVFFRDASLHNPEGRNIMILGLEILPAYQGQGLARELMARYLRKAREGDKKMVVLTCLESKVKMYEKMGFTNQGISESVWGGEQWYEMNCMLNI